MYLDINEVAAFFRVEDARTVRRWIALGLFPSGLLIGGKPTWTGADIAAFMHLRGRMSVEGAEGGGQTDAIDRQT